MLMVREKAFYRQLLRLALPLALQNVITYSVGLADNIMVGRLGELALSGAYVSNQLQNLLHMRSWG
jgi:Na+-driven multidrug efflux pump